MFPLFSEIIDNLRGGQVGQALPLPLTPSLIYPSIISTWKATEETSYAQITEISLSFCGIDRTHRDTGISLLSHISGWCLWYLTRSYSNWKLGVVWLIHNGSVHGITSADFRSPCSRSSRVFLQVTNYVRQQTKQKRCASKR
jgi:hypothetical protein